MQRSYLVILGVLVVLGLGAPARAQDMAWESWVQSFKEKAAAKGIYAGLLEDAFAGLEPDEEVVRLDRKQPENKITFAKYIKNTITPRRIERAREMMAEHRDLLQQVSGTYGVPAKYIIALWAIESDFGNNKGNFSVVQSVATLAYEGRRADFFAGELMAALQIIQNERMSPAELSGSWAGAMGNCQFMPSTYLRYAADGDGDGHRDIWNSDADTFASIANYLHALGWDGTQEWGHEAAVPPSFKETDASLKHGKPAHVWRKLGVRFRPVGDDIEAVRLKGNATLYAMYPGAKEEGIYLVSENFQALLKWNRSRYFATAVGTLADAIGEANE